MQHFNRLSTHSHNRRGSTLVIVIALLGLLVFTGMVFYSFASQEQVAAEFFSEAAKAQYNEPSEVWSHMLEQLIVGPSSNYAGSILRSQRHSLIRNQFGNDVHAHSGTRIVPGTGTQTEIGGGTITVPFFPGINMVDSPAAYGYVSATASNQQRINAVQAVISGRAPGGGLPEPDVDYTYPDVNNMFLAYRGYAIRTLASGVKQQVPVIIPSFFRPQYMMSAQTTTSFGAKISADGTGPTYVPTDPFWAYAHEDNPMSGSVAVPAQPNNSATTDNRNRVLYGNRSFRPHPLHIAGILPDGTITLRYLTDFDAGDPNRDGNTADAIAAGGFPFLPDNASDASQNPGVQGELGVWTGSDPLVYELDVDNDGDGIREGIWLDLHFPMQEVTQADGSVRNYVVMHSVTVYDLDSLINVNVHGNLAGMPKTYLDAGGTTRDHTLPTVFANGDMSTGLLSRSNLGLGPNEVNPLYVLMRQMGGLNIATDQEDAIFAFHLNKHFGALPTTEVELANMLWTWMLMGRGDYDVDVDTSNPSNIVVTERQLSDLFQGRWGDDRLLYAALEQNTPRLNVLEMPRPGRSGNVFDMISSGPSYGGRNGFDDNNDMNTGEPNSRIGRVRPYGHPMDFAGLGQHYAAQYPFFDNNPASVDFRRFVFTALPGTAAVDPRLPIMLHGATSDGPERWRGYIGYSASSDQVSPGSRYLYGPDGTWDGTNGQFVIPAGDTTDDLVHAPNFDVLIEDALETVFDQDLTQRPVDDIFAIGDLIALHASTTDFGLLQGKGELSERLKNLAPYVMKEDQFWGSTDTLNPLTKQPVPDRREMVTTISNTLRQIKLQQPFGGDSRPGFANVDDDGDNTIDEPDEALIAGTDDEPSRWWEFTADSNGQDQNDDGFADGDGQFEFPPRFWSDQNGNGIADANETIQPYSLQDPFRPQLRRMITIEAGESRQLPTALPISVNHVVDVDRTGNTPVEGTPEFLYYMQRSGLRLRSVTDHPDITETGVATTTTMLKVEVPDDYDGDGDIDGNDDDGDPNTVKRSSDVAFPPNTVREREFWARRDRQKLARDIYVLLYTLGGAKTSVAGNIVDYTGQNDPNLAESSGAVDALYTHDQLRRMAQFAVNMVDAMDNDNVVTKFEFDKNLGNGWNLDDDPYSTDFLAAVDQRTLLPTDPGYNKAISDLNAYINLTGAGLYPEDSGQVDVGDIDGDLDVTEIVLTDRGVVYGVEAQQVAFSEVLAVRSPSLAMDHEATPFDDTVGVRDFLYMELQNMLPQLLDLAPTASVNATSAIFRIARFDRTVTDTAGAGPNGQTVRPPGFPTRVIAITNHVDNEIDGGGRFSISATNATDLASSATYVDIGDTTSGNFDGTYELVAPDANGVTLPASPNAAGTTDPAYAPLTDIDIIHTDHGGPGGGRFDVVGGNFLTQLQGDYAGNNAFAQFGSPRFNPNPNPGFDLVIQRRMNPNMPGLSEADNPWVEVDRTRILFQNLGLQLTDTPTEIFDNSTGTATGRLATINSAERREPLNDRTLGTSIAKTLTPYRINTIKGGTTPADSLGVNARSNPNPTTAISAANPANPFTLWQPHFDRDFASTGELLNLPVLSPNLLTQTFAQTLQAPFQQAGGTTSDPINIVGAAGMILMPDFTDQTPATAFETARDNRWYRLFQFVEVPSRVHRMLGNYLNQTRLPGQININMIRHLEVYAGLIDDPMFAHPDLRGDQNNYLREQTPGGVRDRWEEYLQERDGDTITSVQDPTPGVANGDGFTYSITLPGTPGSQPFRSLSHRGTTDNGMDETILRTLDADRNDGAPATNRQWLEVGNAAFHAAPTPTSTNVQRHQILSKILNNTTTVSNSFVVYSTAAYFEAYEDPATGFVRVGGRIDLDNPADNGDSRLDAGEDHDTGWQQRAMFIIDRTDALKAFDPGSGTFDWERLVKHQATIE